jgi:hypothetical protein
MHAYYICINIKHMHAYHACIYIARINTANAYIYGATEEAFHSLRLEGKTRHDTVTTGTAKHMRLERTYARSRKAQADVNCAQHE